MSDIRFNRWLHQSGTGGVSQDSSGNIGIGTTVPTMALDVRGNVNFSDTINATTLSAVDGTFTGNVTIGGTLTYEDVANIDAVGIITAQSDIIVGGGLTVTGISTFNNDVKLLDNDKLKFGIGEDLQIYHNGTHSIIHDSGEGNLRILAGHLDIKDAAGNNHMIVAHNGAAVTLYHNGSEKFATKNTGAVVTGILTATSSITGSNYEIAGISSSISDTAYDVFVYDTRKDSDGGAWRKRTQHTSWYNESLNTSTRGSRKDFPAVAVIVAESTTLTIYDGDDPDLPMWMVFTSGDAGGYTGPHLNIAGGSTLSAVAALNGEIVVTCNSGTYPFGSLQINFLKDRSLIRPDVGGKVSITGIAKRNQTGSYNANYDYTAIADKFANDVAMTVLPNAPIDDSTGLPIPTIAVGTNNGVSVIKDDGSVYDINHTNSGYDVVSQIKIDEKYVYIGFGQASSYVGGIGYAVPIPGADVSLGSIINATSESVFRWSLNSTSGSGGQSDYFINPSDSNADDVTGTVLTKRGMSFGTETGMSILLNEERGKNGSVAYATTSYNTGYMHGDIKGAFLSDTDTTNIVASEMVTNGTFDSNTTGWSVLNTGTFTASGGQATLSDSDGTGTSPVAYQAISGFVVGRTYVLSYDTTAAREAYAYISQTAGQNNQNMYILGYTGSRTGTQTVTFVANSTNMIVNFSDGSGSDFNITVDNVSVKLGDKDRSLNNKGLTAYGTITKSAVATGADLVAYGPFNNSNNFRQPYNSDLNFETNDFSIMFWVYDTGVDQHCTLISRDEREFDISRLANAFGNKLRIYTRNSAEDLKAPDSASALPQNKWTCVCVVYTGGNTKKVYIDGELDVAITSTDGEYDIDSTTYGLNIGVRNTGGTKNYSADGVKLALVRISGGAPSPEQIKKIYEDEKHLFVENAKCTLYGSSDAATALGYDEDTELLHVGTSAGRSDFQGLRRINNTTTAVTTAISASDDLIAEQ